jgi:hypothetical protein
MDALLKFANSPLGLFILGFAFTTVTGGILTAWFQERHWKHRAQLSLIEKRYDEGVKFLDELSTLIGHRLYLLRAISWPGEDRNSSYFKKVHDEYGATTIEWNTKLRAMRNKARLLLGDARALRLVDDREYNELDPLSLHYVFARNALIIQEASDASKVESAYELIFSVSSELMEDFTNELLRRAAKLELMEVPKGDEGELPKRNKKFRPKRNNHKKSRAASS